MSTNVIGNFVDFAFDKIMMMDLIKMVYVLFVEESAFVHAAVEMIWLFDSEVFIFYWEVKLPIFLQINFWKFKIMKMLMMNKNKFEKKEDQKRC